VIPTIRTFNDPILKTVCTDVTAGDDLEWLAGFEQACYVNNGAGLAAPQIGLAKRVIFIAYGKSHGMFLVNPELSDFSPHKLIDREGCLSYPGTVTNVERHGFLTCAWWGVKKGANGKLEIAGIHRRVFRGFEARVLQHEVDHLNGICRVGDAWRAKAGAGL